MRPLCFLFAFALLATVRAVEPAGMLLYKSSPDSSDETARVIEFSKAERFAQVTNYVPLEGGNPVQLFNKQVVALIFYPKISGQTITAPDRIAQLRETAEQMKATAAKFPATLEKLTPRYRVVQEALVQFDSGKVLISGEWKGKEDLGQSSGSSGQTLTVKLADGSLREYKSVKVTGKTVDSLQIVHSGGAVSIPYEQLTDELQKQHGFDPAEVAKYREQKSVAENMPSAPSPVAQIPTTPAEPQPPVGLEAFLREIGPGFSNFARESSEKERFFSGMASLPSFYSASIFERGKRYAIDSLAGQAFFVQQRMDGALLIADINRNPCAILLCEPASLLEGKKLDQGARGWAIGEYKGDVEVTMTLGAGRSFPTFQIDVLCWPTNEGFGFLNFRQAEL